MHVVTESLQSFAKKAPCPEQRKMSLDCFELTKSHAKSSRIRRIQCENGLFLEVLCDGSLSGVKEGTTDYGMLALRCYVCGLLPRGKVNCQSHFTSFRFILFIFDCIQIVLWLPVFEAQQRC